MAMNMKLKMNINKRGSYIIESVICMPMFIASIIAMASIILLYSCIEDSSFIMANEMRLSAIEGKFADDKYLASIETNRKIRKAHSQVEHLAITDFGYKVNRLGNDNMIMMSMNMRMGVKNPLNLAAKASYDLSLATRAYVGKEGEIEPLDEDGFLRDDEPVYIFPKSGKKYHNKSCAYMRAAATPVSFSKNIKRKYGTCPVCMSKNAKYGSMVYVFPRYGENYHLPGCEVMNRHYITISRKTAKKRGYEACSKCGG